MIDILIIIVFGVVTWMVASDGAWGASQTLISTLFAALAAMSLFEPVANFFEDFISDSHAWQHRWDFVCLVGIFGGFTAFFRWLCVNLAPTYIALARGIYEPMRWGAGIITGYLTVAVLMTALHTAPLPREFIGFAPEPARRSPLASLAPDFQWLGFVQYVSEVSFGSGGWSRRVFDGPTFQLPGQTNSVWPSFPIRYATRRERYTNAESSKPKKDTQQPAPRRPANRGGPDF